MRDTVDIDVDLNLNLNVNSTMDMIVDDRHATFLRPAHGTASYGATLERVVDVNFYVGVQVQVHVDVDVKVNVPPEPMRLC